MGYGLTIGLLVVTFLILAYVLVRESAPPAVASEPDEDLVAADDVQVEPDEVFIGDPVVANDDSSKSIDLDEGVIEVVPEAVVVLDEQPATDATIMEQAIADDEQAGAEPEFVT